MKKIDAALTRERELEEVCPMIEAGFALHVLRHGSKAPENAKWSTANVHSSASFAAAYHKGANVGIKLGEPSETSLGFCHLVDIDIRKPELGDEARDTLRELWPEYDQGPAVMSGSGGQSRHHYLLQTGIRIQEAGEIDYLRDGL